MRPKKVVNGCKYSEYIICSFYSPPASKKHKKLLDHLVSSTHALLAKYPKAAVILGADKNSLLLASPRSSTLPRFRQIVTQPTHGNKTIDVIVMNCADLYAVPEVGEPVLPDDLRHAKPSDHRVPVARPLAVAASPVCNEYSINTFRPMPESAVREFLAWILDWGELANYRSPSEQVEAFQKIVDTKVEELFPERKVRITNQDKQFITGEIKTLDRKKKKE